MTSELSPVVGEELVDVKSESILQEVVCGGMAGLIADCFTHPFDTLRCQMQVQVGASRPSLASSMISLVRTHGVGALYRGFGVVSACTIPAHALYFGGYETSKRFFSRYIDTSSPAQNFSAHFVSGLVAELGGALVWNPMDVVKQRVMVRAGGGLDYRSSLQGVSTVWRQDGIRGFYQGFGAALAVYGPFVGIYFSTYEHLKFRFSNGMKIHQDHLPTSVHLCCGFLAGAFAAGMTCPLDVVKTRIQVESKKQNKDTVLQIAKLIYQQEGKSAFLKGITPRVLWIAPASAITIASYELLKRFWR